MTSRFELRAREGDFIETVEGLIFDVKGLIHPPNRIISFLRYIPFCDGERKRDGVGYKKIYDLGNRWIFLRRYFPQYVYFDKYFSRELQGVPVEKVRVHYDPRKMLDDFLKEKVDDKVKLDAIELVQTLEKEAGVCRTHIGISGSVFVGLQEWNSDIDVLIYGIDSSRKIHETLERLICTGQRFERSNVDELKRLYTFRSMRTAMKFEDFCTHELRKVLQGKFQGRAYFIRCVRDWDEVEEKYGCFKYRRVGKARVSAVVSNDSESILTPCIYGVQDVRVLYGKKLSPRRLLSYRGRFCEQARTGERIIAFGELEQVVTESDMYYQLVVGESMHDFILSM